MNFLEDLKINKGRIMKNILKVLVVTMIMITNLHLAKAVEISAFGGAFYKSNYEDGMGRASLRFTHNTGYILISRDRNQCTVESCQSLGLDGNLDHDLFLLEKIKEENDHIVYKAKLIPFSPVFMEKADKEYVKKMETLEITVEADVDWMHVVGGNNTRRTPKEITMKIKMGDKLDSYLLKMN